MENESNTPTQELDGLDALAALLEAEEANPEAAEPTEAQGEPEPEEVEATGEEDDQDQPTKATVEEVEIDGKKYRVDPELKPYILRQQDYTKKTQEVAEQRKAIEAEKAQAMAKAQQYMQGLQIVEKALQTIAPQPASEQLWDEDPIEAAKVDRRYQAHIQKHQAVQQEMARVQHQAMQEQMRLAQEDIAQARAKLPELIPAWKDEKKMATEVEALKGYLAESGYSVDEIKSATDPRAIALSRKAMLYDQLVAKQKAARPVVPKTVEPGAVQPPSRSAATKVLNRLSQTGSRDDAAALLSMLD